MEHKQVLADRKLASRIMRYGLNHPINFEYEGEQYSFEIWHVDVRPYSIGKNELVFWIREVGKPHYGNLASPKIMATRYIKKWLEPLFGFNLTTHEISCCFGKRLTTREFEWGE